MNMPPGGIGGPGFPMPPLPPGHKPGQPVTGPKIDIGRGVDLSLVRDKNKHQHRWVMVANFVVDPKVIAKMAEAKLAAEAQRDKGEIPDQPHVPVPMGPDQMVGVDGPGCAKCGHHWTSSEGYGKLCKVSDDQYLAAGGPVATPGAEQAQPGEVVPSNFGLLDPDGKLEKILPDAQSQDSVAVAMAPDADEDALPDV